ncbi:hypothetical protein A0H81_13595 [Grifola frondosa]|uniref:Uncharacterized protein n=1 Tax=Grifola frondosa TaxID=5627 RepID=A0A1C7LNU9_GRIFR|nr:hypothetical protein A0H81_13595 [Grifola frondosa]
MALRHDTESSSAEHRGSTLASIREHPTIPNNRKLLLNAQQASIQTERYISSYWSFIHLPQASEFKLNLGNIMLQGRDRNSSDAKLILLVELFNCLPDIECWQSALKNFKSFPRHSTCFPADSQRRLRHRTAHMQDETWITSSSSSSSTLPSYPYPCQQRNGDVYPSPDLRWQGLTDAGHPIVGPGYVSNFTSSDIQPPLLSYADNIECYPPGSKYPNSDVFDADVARGCCQNRSFPKIFNASNTTKLKSYKIKLGNERGLQMTPANEKGSFRIDDDNVNLDDWPGYTNNCVKKEKCGSTLTLKEVVVMVAKQFGNFYSNAKRGRITQTDTCHRDCDLLNGRIKRDSIWLVGIDIYSINTKTKRTVLQKTSSPFIAYYIIGGPHSLTACTREAEIDTLSGLLYHSKLRTQNAERTNFRRLVSATKHAKVSAFDQNRSEIRPFPGRNDVYPGICLPGSMEAFVFLFWMQRHSANAKHRRGGTASIIGYLIFATLDSRALLATREHDDLAIAVSACVVGGSFWFPTSLILFGVLCDQSLDWRLGTSNGI